MLVTMAIDGVEGLWNGGLGVDAWWLVAAMGAL